MDEEGGTPQPAGLSVCILFQARASSPVHSCRTALAIPPARARPAAPLPRLPRGGLRAAVGCGSRLHSQGIRSP